MWGGFWELSDHQMYAMRGPHPVVFLVVDPVARLAWRYKGKDPGAMDLGHRGGVLRGPALRSLTEAERRQRTEPARKVRWAHKRKLRARN